jgi:CHASE3 domain sensor protein
MSDDEEPQRSAELEKLYVGMRTAEFFAMSEAEMERAVALLLAADEGTASVNEMSFLMELDRRATKRHTAQVEAYAKKLDWLTRWLVGLTVALVVLTLVLIGLELGVITAGH